MDYGFGVDIGGTTVKIACFDRNGTILDKWEIPTQTENNGSRILPDIAVSVQNYRQSRHLTRILGIGVGVPGPVDSQGIVNRCVNLGWGVFPLKQSLEALTGVPVRAGNDANVAALGECWKGGGAGVSNMVMVTLGTGVGGGIVSQGNIVCGAHGAGGEIGHMKLNPCEQEPCSCGGYGCAEQYCSATGVVRLAKAFLHTSPLSSCLRSVPEFSCKDIFDAGNAGDPAAAEILRQFYDYLGLFLANVCCTADPEVIVLGGGVSKAGMSLLEGVRPFFDRYAFHGCREVRFALAKLGNDAGAYGAFKLILDAADQI